MRRPLAILVGGAVLTATACTTTTAGTPGPADNETSLGQPTTPQSTSNQVPGPGVPKVANPIDTSRFHQAPCNSLTEAQVAELLGNGATAKTDLGAPAGPTCDWHPAGISHASAHVIFGTVDDLGMTGVYQARGTTYKLFEVLEPIEGYPVVGYGTSDTRATDGLCAVAVGTSDRSTMDVAISQSQENVGKTDPCDAARAVAVKVLENVRKG